MRLYFFEQNKLIKPQNEKQEASLAFSQVKLDIR